MYAGFLQQVDEILICFLTPREEKARCRRNGHSKSLILYNNSFLKTGSVHFLARCLRNQRVFSRTTALARTLRSLKGRGITMHRLLVASACLFSFFSFGHQAEVEVALTPVGAFVAKSDAIRVGSASFRDGNLRMSDVRLDLTTLKTGIGLRDQHLAEKYLEVRKSRYAVVTQLAGRRGSFVAYLVLHGVKRRISGNYSMESGQLKASFRLRVSEFKIQSAKYMGVGVEDEIRVEVSINGIDVRKLAGRR